MTTTEITSDAGAARPSALQVARRALTAPTVGPLIALVLTMAFFSYKSDRFLQTENLSLVLQQTMVVGVLAIGQTLVILTAGIDLSVGTVMALGQIVMTKLAVVSGVPPVLALLLGILTCVGFGALNGGLVTLVRLPPFIVTLGTLNIAFALTHIVSNDVTYTGLPEELLFFGRTFHFAGADFTYGVVFMLVLYAITWFALTQTSWGRHVYAVGDNREACQLSGIRVWKVLLVDYVLCSLLAAVAGLVLVGSTNAADLSLADVYLLPSVAAVIIGGTSIFGGRGGYAGSIVGALILTVLTSMLTLLDFPEPMKQILYGAIILLLAATYARLID